MTISLAEAQELAPPSGPVPREAAQRVLDYLIFHRSLLDEHEGTPALLERYLGLVQGMKEGVHVVIDDPFQKATALLFELVMDEAFDPWEIDLVRFTQLYVERVRGTEPIDFAVAGRLVYMAWSILFLQSEGILKVRHSPTELPMDEALAAPIDDGYLGELTTPEDVDVTASVLGAPEGPVLVPMVRHPETRPVSLLELVQAFGAAEVEARRSLRVQELRERLREEQRAAPEVVVHGDIPETDLADVWAEARRRPVGTAFPFLELWRRELGRERLVAIFLACLFLAKEGVLELRAGSPLELVRLSEARPSAPEA